MQATELDTARAIAILKALLAELDSHPQTADAIALRPADTRPVLVAAIAALEGRSPPEDTAEPVSAGEGKPGRARNARNAGKAWTPAEDAELLAAFDHGEPVPAIAAAHERSRLAIEARLARFGRLPMPAGLRQKAGGVGTAAPESSPAIEPSAVPQIARDAACPRYRVSTHVLH